MKKYLFLIALLIGFVCAVCFYSQNTAFDQKKTVNDVTRLNPTPIRGVETPTSIEQVQSAVRAHEGSVSIGGGRYSMGGQISTDNTLFINMQKMNKVVSFSKEKKEITVQSGIRWKDIQNYIDPYDLSVMIMQTYNNFTVGGSLSVNVHGRYIGLGPLIMSVKAIKVVLADGTIVEATPDTNKDIFYGVIGGYGGLGVIVEATLMLEDNVSMERQVQKMPITDYYAFFKEHVRNKPEVVFHNGDIYPEEYKNVSAVSWVKTDKPLTDANRFKPIKDSYWLENAVYFWITELPFGHWVRENWIEPYQYSQPAVVKRNYEASYDVKELEPLSRRLSTYVLQEYFIPVDKFDEFVPKMHAVFEKNHVNVVNVSIRHANKDPGAIMAWAREEVFAFVVYYKQGVSPDARDATGDWTREMIDEILAVGGRYYLPYQPHATQAQFRQAYPDYQTFFDLKKKLDPQYKFRNKLFDKYYHPDVAEQKIWDEKDTIEYYARSEDQTYLTIPEWYIVFSADEYAQSLKNKPPSQFPYFASTKQFWDIYGKVKEKTNAEYPYNLGYNVMIYVIGTSYSAELIIKGIYENTVGRLTEWVAGINGPLQENQKVEGFMQYVAQDYTDFVRYSPWYDYPFWTRLKEFWRVKDGDGTSVIRRWERRIIFTCELLFKTAYAKAIGYVTHASYEKPQLDTYATVRENGALKIMPIPRYHGFTVETPKLVNQGIEFIDIAGNKNILFTIVVPKEWTNPSGISVFYEWPVLTDPSMKRVALLSPVSTFATALVTISADKTATLDHIFDY